MAALPKSESLETIRTLIWISVVVLVVQAYEAPTFIEEPSTNVVFSNSTGGRVLCSAEGHPNPKITWLLSDGSSVSNVQGLRHIQADGTLVFPPFRAEDYRQDVHAAIYKCSASNSMGTLVSKDVKVKGVVSQPYETYVYDVYAMKGNSAVMKCHIPQLLSDYVKVISWIRDSVIEINGKHLNSYDKYEMMPNGDLYIKDVSAEDSLGTFRCQVKDLLSNVKKTSVTAGKLFITEPEGSVPPKILNGKDEILVKEGEMVFLPCVAQGNPSPIIRWLNINTNGREEDIVFNGRRKQISGSLLIRNVQSSDSGLYMCIASNSAGLAKRQTQLTVASSLEISVQPTVVTIDIGKPLKLKCKISGNPVEQITWLHNGKPPSGENIGFENNDTLSIRSTTVKEKGIYQCFAKNDLQIEFGTSILKLGDLPPSFSTTFEAQILHPGSSASMTCEAVGVPTPAISWSVDGIPLSSDGKIRIEERFSIDENMVSKLIIKDLKTEDGGLYSCTASNKAGLAMHAKRLSVYGQLTTRRRPKLTAVNSQKAFLDCPFYGYPHGIILWEKDNIQLPNIMRQTVFENGTLMIQKVFKHLDSGTYKCFVYDENEDSVEGEIQLDVLVPPKIAPFSFQDELVREGMRGRLSCVILEGDLPLTISWEKDGLPVPDGVNIRQIDDFSSILTIQVISPRHNGAYTCVASNAAATVHHTAQLSVNVAPKILPFAFQDDQFFKGMRAHIICAVSQGDSPIDFQWLKDGQQISASLGVVTRNIDGHANSLSIESVSSVHTGNYTCKASNEAATVSHTAQLLVYVAPKIIPFSFQDVNIVEGALARVSCVVYQGDLPITIQWLKDDLPISPTLDIAIRRIDDYSSILTIERVQRNHTGNYSCIASNKAATITHSAQLIVNVPPKIVPFTFQDGNLLEGMLVRVSCVVSRGDLPLTITWLKDNHPISSEKSIVVKDFDEYSSVLSIDPVGIHHNGNYTCLASNNAGSVSYTTPLKIQVPPKWVVVPVNTTVTNGDDAFLHCKTEGLPIPTVLWSKSERTKMSRRKPVSQNKNVVIYKNGTLHLKSVTKSDEGHYFCSASNDVGAPIGNSASLTINAPPVINLTELKYIAKKGNNASLICSCNGNLPIEIEWIMGSTVVNILKGSRFRILNEETKDKNGLKSILTVLWVDRKDSTNVRCIARNEYGQDEVEYIIVIQDSPDPPVFETPIHSMNRSINLKWKTTFDGNSKILRFVIQYKKHTDNWQYKSLNQTVDGSKESLVVNDLTPATTYQFRILAQNEIGKSVFSDIISTAVDEDVPSGAPLNVEVESTDTHTLRITWKPPKKSLWNGAIRGYNIGYRIHGSDDPFAFTTLEVPEDYTEDLIFQLTNLRLYTQYGIIVQAYNAKGSGPSSEEVQAMTSEDVPQSPPQDIRCSALSSKSIYVLWESPQSETVNGILRGYKVLYKPVEEYFVVQSSVTQTTKLTIQGLSINTNYSIQVLAFTKVGDGIHSNPIFCKTHEDVPQALSAVKVLPSSSDSVLVSWKPPQKSSGSITKYNVYYKALEDGQEMEWDLLPSGDSSIKAEELNKGANVHSSPSDAQFFEVKGLKKNKKYAFWVTASSVIGEGPVSQVKAETVADSNVAAKSASFDDEIQTPWKKDIVLSCRAVGVPPPQKKWFSGNKLLEQTPRTSVLSDGTLLINRVISEDSGNYTCSIYNQYGKDEIKYSVTVQVPPSAPLLDIVSKSKTSIQLQWKAGPTGGDRIIGYNLHFRKIKGTWETREVRPDLNVYTLTDLACGNTYQVYMEAINSIGTGPPCDIITVSTEGAEVNPPAKDDLIREGTTFITVNLDSWPNNGCPVVTFTLEYKQRNAKHWTLVANNIKPTQKKLVIPGLVTATWYNLRLISQTSGEAAVVEYNFATHTLNGGTIAPETLEEEIHPVYIFYLDPYIFIPAVALLIVVIIASVVVCIYMKRRNGSDGTPSVFYSDDGSNLNTWTHRTLRKSGNTFIHSDGYATINPRNSDPNPYASSRLPDCNPGSCGIMFTGPNPPSSADLMKWNGPSNTLTRQSDNSGIVNHGPAATDNRHCSAFPGVQETTFVFPGNMNHPPFTTPVRGKTEDGYDPPPFGI